MVMMQVSGLVERVTSEQQAVDDDLVTAVHIVVETAERELVGVSVALPDNTAAWLYAAEQFEGAAKELRRLAGRSMGTGRTMADLMASATERVNLTRPTADTLAVEEGRS